jgi:TM2 domain-containing membrane protein YozV
MTVLFALFLGWLWVHRMYLWQKLIWFLYLIFCWTFIPWIIALVEVFYFALIKQETFDNTYNLDYILKKKQLENLNLNK